MPAETDRIFEGADLPTAVPTVGVPVGFRCLSPEQTGHLMVQDGLVAFDSQDPVRAAVGEIGDRIVTVVTLAVQRVDGDDHTE